MRNDLARVALRKDLILLRYILSTVCTHDKCNKKARHEWLKYELNLCNKHQKQFTNDIKKMIRED